MKLLLGTANSASLVLLFNIIASPLSTMFWIGIVLLAVTRGYEEEEEVGLEVEYCSDSAGFAVRAGCC